MGNNRILFGTADKRRGDRFDHITRDEALRQVSDRDKLSSAFLVIGKQFRLKDGDRMQANRRLAYSVVERAIADAVIYRGKHDGDDAANYLAGDIRHASLCGVDAEWIRDKLDAMRISWRPKYGDCDA